MGELLLVAVVTLAIGLPHALPLQRVAPAIAVAVWLGALSLRAIVGAATAIFLVLYLPQTSLFHGLASWCAHAVLPLLATHLGLSGHSFADAAMVLPALALSASLLWVVSATAWAGVVVGRRLRARSLGSGPHGSELIGERRILVAATGLGRSRVVVSAGAVAALDEAELEASVAHERGHIERRHHLLLLAGDVLGALGRLAPGTRRARRELRFALERDADEFAVRSTRDPLALASAICKAGSGVSRSAAPLVSLAGEGVVDRVRCLTDPPPEPPGRLLRFGSRSLALLMATLVLALVSLLPAWAGASAKALRADQAPSAALACD